MAGQSITDLFGNAVSAVQDVPTTLREIEDDARNARLYAYATLGLLAYIAIKVSKR